MIENRIIKTDLIGWKRLEWLQNPNLKEMSKDSFLRLKNSLKMNNFIMPFNVWEDDGRVWILDGHHRKKALEEIEKEGIQIPDELPANFINCRNRKEAVKLILVYSSIYANVTSDGLYELINTEGLDFGDIKMDIDLPEINFDKFEKEYFDQGDGKGGTGGGGKNAGISYVLIFNNEDEQTVWFRYIRWLKNKYPDAETISARIMLEIAERMGE